MTLAEMAVESGRPLGGLQRHEGSPKEKDDQGNDSGHGQGEIKIDHASQRWIRPDVQEQSAPYFWLREMRQSKLGLSALACS
jgi:hypothetical protein